ncbi:MAG: hypothetical protein IPP79_08075 [Chitinophagaceae bacterium]|nr:hypothetical protein [Chitinophagaceae bacterium]
MTIATHVNSPNIFSIKSIGDTGAAYSVFDSTFFDVKKLPLGYRRLEYSFGAAAMSNFDNLQFRYRLLSKDSSWIFTEGGKDAVSR